MTALEKTDTAFLESLLDADLAEIEVAKDPAVEWQKTLDKKLMTVYIGLMGVAPVLVSITIGTGLIILGWITGVLLIAGAIISAVMSDYELPASRADALRSADLPYTLTSNLVDTKQVPQYAVAIEGVKANTEIRLERFDTSSDLVPQRSIIERRTIIGGDDAALLEADEIREQFEQMARERNHETRLGFAREAFQIERAKEMRRLIGASSD
jgi:hypothetical protein